MTNFNVLRMLVVYVVVIGAVLLSHALILYRSETYEKKRNRKIENWHHLFETAGRTDLGLSKSSLCKLKNELEMSAFTQAIEESQRGKAILTRNQMQICKVAGSLRQPDMRAYFAWLLKERELGNVEHEEYLRILMRFIRDGQSVFERENTLLALYSLHEPEHVAQAWQILSERDIYHSTKLLCNDLLKAPGEKEEYAAALTARFYEMAPCYQLAVINYLRYAKIYTYNEQFRSLMRQNPEDDDLCCAVIRLIAGEKEEVNRDLILDQMLKTMNTEHWASAAVAAGSLFHFDDEETVKALEAAIHSRSWYVRVNAARALVKKSSSTDEIQEILNGDDRYAKDEMIWALDQVGGLT